MSSLEKDWQALDILQLPPNKQAQLVRQIKRGDVSSVYPMIVKAADNSWGRLPPHTRTWYTKEEAIAAGVAYTVTKVAKEFDKNRGVKFSTFLQDCLTNFYITIESEPLRAEKRWEGGTISLQDFVRVDNRWKTSAEFYITHTLKQPSLEDEIIARVDAIKHFLQVYNSATPNLRKYLIRWFLTTKVIRMKDGEEIRAARRELRKLASLHGFNFEMALFLATNDLARLEAAIEIQKKFTGKKIVDNKKFQLV
jgi:hypothetical protein